MASADTQEPTTSDATAGPATGTSTPGTMTAALPSGTGDQLAERLLQVWTDAGISLLLVLAHRTGMLDALAARGPSTSDELAQAAGLQERYVRELLEGLFTARLLTRDAGTGRYAVPAPYVPYLTTSGGPDNMARLMRYTELVSVADKVEHAARYGGGTSYADYTTFYEVQTEDSTAVFEATLVEQVVPLVPGLTRRLAEGVDVVDLGCGRGRAMTLLAETFPASRFTGLDLTEDAVEHARADAAARGLTNVEFRVQDVARWSEPDRYDLVTAFDAVHDQADPAALLHHAREALRADGAFLMVDMAAWSTPEENLALPWAPMLYAISVLHCMTVSLGQGGLGLGTAWGRQRAVRMLTEAGFGDVTPVDLADDPFNVYYVARP